MKNFTLFVLALFLSMGVSFAQRISELTIDGKPSSVPFAAFNPQSNGVTKDGEGEIVFPPNTDLSNVDVMLNVGPDATVTEPNPLPTDWTQKVTGIKVVVNPDSSAIYNITAKVINPAPLPLEITTGSGGTFNSGDWTPATLGWAGVCIDDNRKVVRIGGEGRSFMIAFSDVPDVLTYTINYLNKDGWQTGGVIDVDASSDGTTWTSIKMYNDATPVPTEEGVEVELSLDQNVRFVRWIYTNRVSSNIKIENISVTKGAATSIGNQERIQIGAYLSNNNLVLRDNSLVAEVSLYNITGKLVYNTLSPQSTNVLPGLSKGIYLLKMKLNDGNVVSEKLVMQ